MKKSSAYVVAMLAAAGLGAGTPAAAMDWVDNAVSVRYGRQFAEPYNDRKIDKTIAAFTHASGYAYGSNFLNVDLLFSDRHDPKNPGGSAGAEEAYLVYRHTLDIGKISGQRIAYGPLRDLGLTAGFDLNGKQDAGYNSRKRMLVAGPTVHFEVPGFVDLSLLALWESNAPQDKFAGTPRLARYSYRNHPMLNLAWGVPLTLGGVSFAFEGYANFIAAKGRDEFGNPTAPETNIDLQAMFDLGSAAGLAKGKLRGGVEYQYWRNKFGNPASVSGSTARTPMLRVDYHF
jgi:nucleoside-specific outer membrane channel protein Tsx